VSHVYCPECGFQNPESANYCARCGALLEKEKAGDETTLAFEPGDGTEDVEEALEDLGIKGPALVVRSGGGRTGETFHPEGERTTIGRSPDCEIFLDDVTVSRQHAVLVERDGSFVIEDQGSLNGTFVNRRRIESAVLDDGDELQIGKYRLTFLNR
jgi:FHA domain/zinc-ribbon domain